MKIRLSLLLLAVLSSVAACSTVAPEKQPTVTPVASTKPLKSTGRIIAEGRVVPVRSAVLSFQTGGAIAEMQVKLGKTVQAGEALARLDTRQLELQLVSAEANLASAQAKLDQLKRSPRAGDVAAAEQSLRAAQAAYDTLLHPSPSELAALKADVDKTRALLEQAQAAYDRVGGDGNEHAGMLPQRAQLQLAWLDNQKAIANYETRTKPSNGQVQQALASIETARNQLARLQPAAEEIAAAEANVNGLRAARDLIAQQIKNATLTAPFAGTISSLDLKAGEFAAPGAPVLRLADLSAWQVETTDLTELSIINVKEGDAVTLSFDSLPDLEALGRVSAIKWYGENRQGDIVYTVVVTPEKMDPRWRWNMTAKVSIEGSK